ncbi:hypothetical protein BD770DRAFT_417101 [Pilaira anomala]|nr:hypothetical protein BD770DRAFT_417101 [Pilaira anomala]
MSTQPETAVVIAQPETTVATTTTKGKAKAPRGKNWMADEDVQLYQLHTLNLMVNQVNNLQDTLPGQLESINKSLIDFQARLSQVESQVQEVYSQVHLQQQQHLLIKSQDNIKIRLPAPFSGQASSCSTFFSQLSLYFAGNLGYNTDEKKILLATSCLSGAAYAYMEPFLGKLNAPPAEKPEVLTCYQVFMDTITSAFVPQDERIRRNQEKACYYCGENGHFSNQCPAKRAANQRPTISTLLLGDPELNRPSISMINNESVPNRSSSPVPKPITSSDSLNCVHIRFNHAATGAVRLPVCVRSTLKTESNLALVDTGATVSVISKELADRLEAHPFIHPTIHSSTIEVANGCYSELSGYCTIKMRLGNSIHHDETMTFAILENCSSPSSLVSIGSESIM